MLGKTNLRSRFLHSCNHCHLCFFIFFRGLIFVILTFLQKCLHHSVPCGVVYQIKVVILSYIFIKNLSKSQWRLHLLTKWTYHRLYEIVPFCLDFEIQGCLKPVEIIVPKGSILDPSETAAVVGGNVLTSQRVVDVILRAFGICAASQVSTFSCFDTLTI